MKKYYLHDGKKQHGPFSLDELKVRGITKDTPVWTTELSDWTPAGEILELNSIVNSAPPPFNRESTPPPGYASNSEKTGRRIGRVLGLTGVILVVVVLTGFIVYKSQNSSNSSLSSDYSHSEKTPEELRFELELKEKTSPEVYLVPTVTVRGNFAGETIVEGSVMNNASIAVFQDIVLEVTFLSKTGTAISSKIFTIYEVAAPGKWASFKFRTYAPSDTKQYSAKVIRATPTPS